VEGRDGEEVAEDSVKRTKGEGELENGQKVGLDEKGQAKYT
jgi:hypothetical protein